MIGNESNQNSKVDFSDQESTLNEVVEPLSDTSRLVVRDVKPMDETECLQKLYEQSCKKKLTDLCYQFDNDDKKKGSIHELRQFRDYVDNPPKWNPKCKSYVFNFRGRVLEASIKNFQLVPN